MKRDFLRRFRWLSTSCLLLVLLIAAGCTIQPAVVNMTVIGVDWSWSLYLVDEEYERERTLTLVRNIIEAKNPGPLGGFSTVVRGFHHRFRPIPLEHFLILPLASDEVSYREQIISGTPRELLATLNDPATILPRERGYTHKTDFYDFFDLAYHEVNKFKENFRHVHQELFETYEGHVVPLLNFNIEYVMITDGIYDPAGRINLPNLIDMITTPIIARHYPGFTARRFAERIPLSENTSAMFFIGIPPRIRHDLWQVVMDEKNLRSRFLDHGDLQTVGDIRRNIFR